MAAAAPILITADEINCLIHAYFEDSGYQHTAFCLRAESKLEHGPNYTKHVRRGELVDLLSKALLYVEVEAHWHKDAVTTSCRTPFTLLDEHRCSADAKQTQITVASALEDALATVDGQSSNGNKAADGEANKRKAIDQLAPSTEKKARTDESPLEKPAGAEDDPSGKTNGTSTPRNFSVPKDPWAIQKLTGHKTEVFVCAWNPVIPSLLATGDKGCVVNMWEVPDPPADTDGNIAPPPTIIPIPGQFSSNTTQGDLTAFHWNVQGTLLAVGSYDCVLRVLQPDGTLYFSNTQHKGPIFAVKFSHSGNKLLTGSLDGTACVWDIREKKLINMYRCHVDCCLQVEWLDDNIFATCGADKLINIIRVGDSRPMKTLTGHTNEVNMVKYHAPSKRLASCSDDRTARVWPLKEILREGSPPIPGLGSNDMPNAVLLRGHKNNVGTMEWCPAIEHDENPILATSGFDGTVRLWDSTSGECLKVFNKHKTPIFCMAFDPLGHFLASGGGDGKVIVYDIKNKTIVWIWHASKDTPGKDGVFEIDWQGGSHNRLAVTLESQKVAVIDFNRIPELRPLLTAS